ncbi:MAG: hypothetical protein HQL09_04490 [Nitrospirae bacterium]|nr:hypothetical protein [Nitrospirota bacterium]
MRIWLALIILMTPVTSAFAFEVEGLRPLAPYGVFSTFSAESLKQNHVGFSAGIERVAKPDFYRTTMQVAYGLHDRFEIDMTLPYVFDWQNHYSGLEDANFGIKHRVLDEGVYYPAVAYLLKVALPSGNDEFSTRGEHGAGLVFTKKVGPFEGHFNLLYDKPGESDLHGQYSFNLGTELAVTRDSRLLGELLCRNDYFKNKISLVEWRLGYRIATLENLYTTIGAGFNLETRSPDYRLLFSVSIILPKEKRTLQKIREE